jgi:hypothetical protein
MGQVYFCWQAYWKIPFSTQIKVKASLSELVNYAQKLASTKQESRSLGQCTASSVMWHSV